MQQRWEKRGNADFSKKEAFGQIWDIQYIKIKIFFKFTVFELVCNSAYSIKIIPHINKHVQKTKSQVLTQREAGVCGSDKRYISLNSTSICFSVHPKIYLLNTHLH